MRRAGSRTIVERVRYDGISRCSRAFRAGSAALVVVSQLGPGVVRGDAVSTGGTVGPDAHLIVTNQTATRLMGGPLPSSVVANWTLAQRAILELVGEPLVASAAASFESSTEIELGDQALIFIMEVTSVPIGAAVRLRTSIKRRGHELFYDAFDAALSAPQAVGTLAIIGLAEARIAPLIAVLDRAADAVDGPAIGVGALRYGVLARILSPDIWAVRALLAMLRDVARDALLKGDYRSFYRVDAGSGSTV